MIKKSDFDYSKGYFKAHRDYYLRHGKRRGQGVDYKTASDWARKDCEYMASLFGFTGDKT